jgi:hypothetical protein
MCFLSLFLFADDAALVANKVEHKQAIICLIAQCLTVHRRIIDYYNHGIITQDVDDNTL